MVISSCMFHIISPWSSYSSTRQHYITNLATKNDFYWTKIRTWPLSYWKWCRTRPALQNISNLAKNERFLTGVVRCFIQYRPELLKFLSPCKFWSTLRVEPFLTRGPIEYTRVRADVTGDKAVPGTSTALPATAVTTVGVPWHWRQTTKMLSSKKNSTSYTRYQERFNVKNTHTHTTGGLCTKLHDSGVWYFVDFVAQAWRCRAQGQGRSGGGWWVVSTKGVRGEDVIVSRRYPKQPISKATFYSEYMELVGLKNKIFAYFILCQGK